jgi:hypothetical protein
MYRDTNSHMLFIVADACATAWPDEFVDVLIDKGTLQSLLLLCDGVSRVAAFAREMWRLLRPGGKMIQIMAGRGMQTYLNLPDLAWSIKHKVVPRKGPGGVANVYIFTKPFSAGGPSYTPSSEPQRQHSTCEKRSTNISNCEIRNTSCDAARRPATAPAGPATWSLCTHTHTHTHTQCPSSLPLSAFPASKIPLTATNNSSSSSSSVNEGRFPPSPALVRDPLRAG